MRTLAEEILVNNRSFVEELAEEYPTHFDTNNLTITQNNYFLVASKYRLGTAQTNQFQSGNQYGTNWHWGSKCTETNGAITCDSSASPANNALAEMPREYSVSKSAIIKGNYYNYYSATADSGRYNWDSTYTANDSVCPSGWKLPSYDRPLPFGVYGISQSSGKSGVLEVRRFPFAFPADTLSYSFTNGSISGVADQYNNATGFGGDDKARVYTTFIRAEYYALNLYGNYQEKPTGRSIRCVVE